MKFKAKIDRWAHLMMLILVVETILTLYLGIDSGSGFYLGIGIVLAMITFVFIPVYCGTYYLMEDNDLIIRSGVFLRKKIPYTVITRAVKTNDMAIISIAFSLERLDFRYREKGQVKKLLIAPENRDLFQRMLLLKNPMIQIDDNQPKIYDLKEAIRNGLDLNPKGEVPSQYQKRTEPDQPKHHS